MVFIRFVNGADRMIDFRSSEPVLPVQRSWERGQLGSNSVVHVLGLNHGLNITAESGFRFLWLVVSEDYNLQDLLAQISFAEEH